MSTSALPLKLVLDPAGNPSAFAEFVDGQDFIGSGLLELSGVTGTDGTLSGLTDTSTFPNAVDGQVLRRSNVDGLWVGSGVVQVSATEPPPHDGAVWLDTSIDGPSSVATLSGLSDTSTFPDIVQGQILVYNSVSSLWIASGAVQVSSTAPPTYDGALWLDTSIAGLSGVSDNVAIETITITTTLSATQRVILGDCTASTLSATLPSASSVSGKLMDLKKIDSTGNDFIVKTNGEDIDGFTSKIISNQYDSMTVVSNGTHWWII